eukprot:COSAG01_NODE_5214_length_4406_cov_5.918737_4_plen_105_part_00
MNSVCAFRSALGNTGHGWKLATGSNDATTKVWSIERGDTGVWTATYQLTLQHDAFADINSGTRVSTPEGQTNPLCLSESVIGLTRMLSLYGSGCQTSPAALHGL